MKNQPNQPKKTSRGSKKFKNLKINRAVYLSTVIILIALAAVLTITVINNQAKKNATVPPDDDTTPVINETPGDTPVDDVPVVVEVVPEFRSPVDGKLLKQHDAELPVFSQTLQDYRVHLGIDITTAENAPVCAAADGTVSKIWEDPMMGWCVAVNHSGDCVTVYKNLSSLLADGIAEGSRVLQGQLIGNVGDSAICEIAEEPHLHMEMTIKGLQVNPLDYFSAAVIANLATDTSFEESVISEK